MNIYKLYTALTANTPVTSTMKLSIYDLQKVYSYIASLPLREESEGLNTTKLLNLLNVTAKDVSKELPDGLELRRSVVIQGLQVRNEQIHVPNCSIKGFAYKRDYIQLSELLNFVRMQNEYIPSKWLLTQGAAYEDPGTSAMAPFVLLAYKKYKGTPFNAWNKHDQHMNLLLPKNLIGLPDCASTREFSKEELRGIVELMFYANKQKQPVKPTGYPLLSLNTAIPRAVELGIRDESVTLSDAEVAFNGIPTNLRRMFLQIWLYNKKYRTSDVILDPKNWSAIPDDIWEGFIGFASLGAYRATNINLIFSQGEL